MRLRREHAPVLRCGVAARWMRCKEIATRTADAQCAPLRCSRGFAKRLSLGRAPAIAGERGCACPSPSACGCHLSQGERQEGDGKCVSIAEMAQEVLDGKWGNGEERKQKLGAWFYDLVQGEVNRILGV